MRNYFYSLALLTITLFAAQTTSADVKIKSKQTMSGQSYENTTYIKGKRQRTESMNGVMISLTQCDLRRSVQINPQARTYMVNPFAAASETTVAQPVSAGASKAVVESGGKVTTTITTKDTGERRQMFGFTARHLIITMETASSPDACNKTNTKIQTDGWYIDAEFALDCDLGYSSYGYGGGKNGGCRDRYEVKNIGGGKRGYPVYERMTMFDANGKESFSILNEVVELSKATLEAALFEIPSDYREVSEASQMHAASAVGGSTGSRTSSMTMPDNDSDAGRSSSSPPVIPDSPSVGPKKPGHIRIGIAGVKTGAVGSGINAAELAKAVQNTLIQYLKAPKIEVVTIEAKLASAVAAEARELECEFVITANVSHKKGGGGFGNMFGSALGSAVGRVGIGHTGSTAGNIAGQIATQSIVSAASMSASVRSKDEIVLEVNLMSSGGSPILVKSYRAKAKSDGDDIISQVVEYAAEAIASSIQIS